MLQVTVYQCDTGMCSASMRPCVCSDATSAVPISMGLGKLVRRADPLGASLFGLVDNGASFFHVQVLNNEDCH